MNAAQWVVALSMGLFAAMLACLEIGYRIGRQGAAEHPELAHKGIGAVEAAVFALLGLLLAFSFSGATSRLDARRQLIVQEANAIGTSYLRLDLLPVNDHEVHLSGWSAFTRTFPFARAGSWYWRTDMR